jgi:hypothetical protein
VLSLALSSSQLAAGRVASAVMVVLGWCIAAPLIAAGLRVVAPTVPLRRALLVGVGWPVCILLGLALPIVLDLSAEGAAIVGLAVIAAGLLAALAAPGVTGEPIRWDRVLLVDIGFAAGWVWPGTTTWPEAFWQLGHGYADSFPELHGQGFFPALVSAGLLSGLVGGLLLYFVLLRPSRRAVLS